MNDEDDNHDPIDIAMEMLEDVKKVRDCDVVVYFIQGGDLVKIGVTDDYNARFNALKSMSPIPLFHRGRIRCDRFFERIVHWRFEHLRTHGEWFHYNQEIVDFLEKYIWVKEKHPFVQIVEAMEEDQCQTSN